MFQYRHVLVRMRQGDSDRDIKRAKLMGRRKAAELREVAEERGWLQAESELPDDATIAGALGESRRAASTISSAEPHRTITPPKAVGWVMISVGAVTILHSLAMRKDGAA